MLYRTTYGATGVPTEKDREGKNWSTMKEVSPDTFFLSGIVRNFLNLHNAFNEVVQIRPRLMAFRDKDIHTNEDRNKKGRVTVL